LWKGFKVVPVKDLKFNPGVLNASHIKQGNIGNCAFIAALRTLARRYPHFVSQIIIELDDKNVLVKLFKQVGKEFQPIYYKIEKTIIVAFTNLDCLFSESKNIEENWIKLIEKALVFHQINGGFTEKNLPTGRESTYEDLICDLGQEKVYSILLGCYVRKMVAACLRFGKAKQFLLDNEICTVSFKSNKLGVVEGHAYELVNFAKKDEKEFVILSNPWGWNPYNIFSSNKMDLESFEIAIKYKKTSEQDKSLLIVPMEQFQKLALFATMTYGAKNFISDDAEEKFAHDTVNKTVVMPVLKKDRSASPTWRRAGFFAAGAAIGAIGSIPVLGTAFCVTVAGEIATHLARRCQF
jgi:hypothetical protein